MTTLEAPASRDVPISRARAADQGLRIPARLTAPQRPTERHPWLLPWAVRAHRARRRLSWWTSGTRWAAARSVDDLPVRVTAHSSLLLRRLSEREMVLQHGKVVNLRLATARVDGLLVRPGESFSFNHVVGNCTRRQGYVEGMRLSHGEAEAGVGGGICQLANLLHWMFLHSPLTVVERSEHSFDPFPDRGRVLPWGVGCSIVYNYVDLVVRNDTDHTFQLRTWVDDRHLRGLLLADAPTRFTYSVEAREERFFGYRGSVFRANQIWRRTIDRRTGRAVADELVTENCALVMYHPRDVTVIEVVD